VYPYPVVQARTRSPSAHAHAMDAKAFHSAATLALRPTYRHLFLKTQNKKSPFIIMLNPNDNHFHFVALDLDNAAANHAAGKAVDVFLVDSLGGDIKNGKATKFLILAAVHFMRQDFDWMSTVVQGKTISHHLTELETFPTPVAFMDELKNFKINISHESMEQSNLFDCGIFTILQMDRLSRFLYGHGENVQSFAAETLRAEHVRDCLGQTILGVKPATQANVDKWRTLEFFYLLSTWIVHVNDIFEKAGGSFAALNETLGTDFKSLTEIPYIGVNYDNQAYYMKCANYAELKLVVANKTGEKTIKILELKDKKWWKHIKFIHAPSARQLPKHLHREFKTQTETVQYVPSLADLCRFYPGHSHYFDKFIASDYLFWKLALMDKRIVNSKNTCANVGLCINSFHLGKTAELLKNKATKKRKPAGKLIDLISDDEEGEEAEPAAAGKRKRPRKEESEDEE